MLNIDKRKAFFSIELIEHPKSTFKFSQHDKNDRQFFNKLDNKLQLDDGTTSNYEETNNDDEADSDDSKAETWPTLGLKSFKQRLFSILNKNHLSSVPAISKNYLSKTNAMTSKIISSSVVKNSKINKTNFKSKTSYDNFLNQTRYPFSSAENIKSNQSQSSSQNIKVLSFSSSTMLLLSTTTSKVIKYSASPSTSSLISNHRLSYKNNEMYSILVSMFTAALFLIFIMWRWFKMKSDLKRALREQLEIQQMDGRGGLTGRNSTSSSRRTTPSSSSSSSTCNGGHRWTSHYHHYRHHNHHFYHHNRLLNSAKRQKLQATAASIIAQLANGETRSPEEHRQMISTAKCCLEQLKEHARLISHNRFNTRESDNLNNYYNFYSRYDGQPPVNYSNRTIELSCSRNIPLLHNSSLHPTHNHTMGIPQSFSSSSSVADYSQLGYQQCATINENPPSYESLIKSSSLPSYYNFATEEEKQLNKN
jgi:hypothetical protein